MKKPLKLELSLETTCFTQYFSYLNPKGEDSRCKIDGYLYIKTKMSMAGLIFEPHPPNFENQYNF